MNETTNVQSSIHMTIKVSFFLSFVLIKVDFDLEILKGASYVKISKWPFFLKRREHLDEMLV